MSAVKNLPPWVSPTTLADDLRAAITTAGLDPWVEVVTTWPAHVHQPGESDEDAQAEAQRLHDEEWSVVVRPRT